MPEARRFDGQRRALVNTLLHVFQHIDPGWVKVVLVVGCVTGWSEHRSIHGTMHRVAQEFMLNRYHTEACGKDHQLQSVTVKIGADINTNANTYAKNTVTELNAKTQYSYS